MLLKIRYVSGMTKRVQGFWGVFFFAISISFAQAQSNTSELQSVEEAELSDDLSLLAELSNEGADTTDGIGDFDSLALRNDDNVIDSLLEASEQPDLFLRTERQEAAVIIKINKNPGRGKTQYLEVLKFGKPMGKFLISTGDPKRVVKLKNGKKKRSSETPSGWFDIHGANRSAWSETYQSSMPYALFFQSGSTSLLAFAIHAHYQVTGYRASGGCVRMKDADAAKLWSIVMSVGTENTLVHVF